ncbi:hypothetical protein MMC28_002589 [Mycoblastus sanguinarius]|nr:hypothetical protein [Mycoblastus sanguinarius]
MGNLSQKRCGPALFDLARELRDRIYAYLLSEASPPSCPEKAIDRWQEEDRWNSCQHRVSTMYEQEPAIYACAGLLCCNRQAYLEVLEAITRKTATDGIKYKLDCMSNGTLLWPTWIALPAPLKYVRRMDVDYRLFIGEDGQKFEGESAHLLLGLLGKLVGNGPHFTNKHRPGWNLHIDVLEINYVPVHIDLQPLVFYADYVKMNVNEKEYISDTYGPQVNILWGVERELGCLVDSSLLFGKVNVLRLRCGDKIRQWKMEENVVFRNTYLGTDHCWLSIWKRCIDTSRRGFVLIKENQWLLQPIAGPTNLD